MGQLISPRASAVLVTITKNFWPWALGTWGNLDRGGKFVLSFFVIGPVVGPFSLYIVLAHFIG